MVVGVLSLTFILHECHSLKAKRKIVKSIISKYQNTYNASVAETGANDTHGRAEIGIAIVGNDRRTVNSRLDKMIDHADSIDIAELFDSEYEIINY